MSYTLVFDSLPAVSTETSRVVEVGDCDYARKGCVPAYVFSVEGQIHFRESLRHLSTCRRRQCMELKRMVWEGMREKLIWLFKEDVLLGCVHVQPYLYGATRVMFDRNRFTSTAHHLAQCPKESCAQLRRAVLLRVRDNLRLA